MDIANAQDWNLNVFQAKYMRLVAFSHFHNQTLDTNDSCTFSILETI